MGLSIGKDMLEAADKITITINPNKLGRMQLGAMRKAFTSGVCHQYSVPHKVAYKVLQQEGRPVVRIGSWGEIHWHNVPTDSDMFDKLLTQCVVSALGDSNTWRRKALENSRITLGKRESTGSVSMPDMSSRYAARKEFIETFKGFRVNSVDLMPTEPIEIDVTPEAERSFSSI